MAIPKIYNKAEYVNFPGYLDNNGNPDIGHYLEPISITFHNTADYYGGNSGQTALMYAEYYHNTNWFGSNPPGIAHFYVDGRAIVQMIDKNVSSWGNGSPEKNKKYFTIEICDNWFSSSSSNYYFTMAEENAFWYAAKLIREEGLSIDAITLHCDVYATECPKRSKTIHGGTEATRKYMKQRVMDYYNNPNKPPEGMLLVPEGQTGIRYLISGGNWLNSNYLGYNCPGGIQNLEFVVDTGEYWADEYIYNNETWFALSDDTYRFFFIPLRDVNNFRVIDEHEYGVDNGKINNKYQT